MSMERALIARSEATYIPKRLQAVIESEAAKGCTPELFPAPVSLEPPYQSFAELAQVGRPQQDIAAGTGCQLPVTSLSRMKVWIPAEQGLNWLRSEQFLKSLTTVRHRVGLEVIGNSDKISFYLFAHPDDAVQVVTAFKCHYDKCLLTQVVSSPWDTLPGDDDVVIDISDYYPPRPYSHLFTQPDELRTSPFETVLTALSSFPATDFGVAQVVFQPVPADHNWHENINILLDLEYAVKLVGTASGWQRYPAQQPSGEIHDIAKDIRVKAHNDKPIFAAALRLAVLRSGQDRSGLLQQLGLFTNLFQHGGRPLQVVTTQDYRGRMSRGEVRGLLERGATYRHGFLLNSSELVAMMHLPPGEQIESRGLPIELLDPLPARKDDLLHGTPIGTCREGDSEKTVCIPGPIRSRSTHLIARHGMGKSTLMEYMVLHDIQQGAGLAVLDPHGDLVYRLTHLIPAEHIDKVIHFHLADPDWIPLWNPIHTEPGQDLSRTADDIVAAIKNIVQGWGDRLENLLRHAVFALLHLQNSTLLDISNLLRKGSKESRLLIHQIMGVLDNETARLFWEQDFARYNNQDLSPPKHKLSKLLLSGTSSLMLSQPESRINFRQIMDQGKVLLMDLSGIGTDLRELLGSFSLSLLRIAALGRSNIPAEQRKPFHIYCDEAHRFLSASIEDLIAETRKFGVDLTLAHQYLRQFDQAARDSILTCGSTIVFNVDMNDARYLSKDFQGLIEPDDLATFEVGEALARIGTDLVRIRTQKPLDIAGSLTRDAIIEKSHQTYYKKAEEIRETLRHRNDAGWNQWGMAAATATPDGKEDEFRYEEFD